MNQYTIIKPLADALFGQVHLAKTKTGKHVAIKQMNLFWMKSQREQWNQQPIHENGFQETMIYRLFQKHRPTNILTLHQQIKTKCDWYLVFDYCSGGELFDKVGTFESEAVIQRYFSQIVNGVQFMHAQGYAHRDLSLENVLIDEMDQCQLCDFGLATSVNKYSNQRVGKHFYMAPEVYEEKRYHPGSADMWSLGIVLFILLTSRPLAEIPCPDDPHFKYLQVCGVRALLREFSLKTWSPEVIDVLERLLVVNPKHRMTMAELRKHPWILQHLIINKANPFRGLHKLWRKVTRVA